MKSITTTKSLITKMTTHELKRDDFIALLEFQGVTVNSSDKVKVYVDVPGGGDFANCELTLEQSPIYIEVISVTEETSTDG